MKEYQPVDCGRHSEFELMAMRQQTVRLTISPDSGLPALLRGQVRDVFVRDKAEYLKLKDSRDIMVEIRLDWIEQIEKA